MVAWEGLYGSDPAEVSLSLRFAGVVRRACEKTGERVVILVDEYDKPMLQAINSPELQEEYRNTLKPFYGVLKSMDGYIKFALLTGSYVYVMEFKLDGSAEQALQQIEDKQYALPFAKDSRTVYKIGANFSSGTRNIDRWIVK